MRSSFCRFGDCVEVLFNGHGQVRVWDSADRSTWLVFTREEWTAFLAGVRNGEFDVPPAGDAHELGQTGPPK